MNLRAADVPGAVVGAVQEPGFVVRLGHEGPVAAGPFDNWIERCDGGVTLGAPRQVVGYSSPNFTLGASAVGRGASIEGVRSVVFVFAGEAAARHELSVLGSSRARACLQHDGDALGGAGSETHLEISALASAPGASASGVSWSAIPSSYRDHKRRYRDLLAFAVGRMLVVLHATGLPRPVEPALEARLLRLLYSRAQAYAQ